MRRVMSMGRLARLETTIASRAAHAATAEERRRSEELNRAAGQILADPEAYQLAKRLAIRVEDHVEEHGLDREAGRRWAAADPECTRLARELAERMEMVKKGGD